MVTHIQIYECHFQKINAPSASSALVKRIFSAASNVYGKRRINLKPDYVESMMRIKINCVSDDKIKVDITPHTEKEFCDIFGDDHPFFSSGELTDRLRYISPSTFSKWSDQAHPPTFFCS